MSEFNESFGVSKLLGSPAGYIGYKESNNFTDKIKNNPHCVILFDEIDKAHKDVTKILLQMLENGEVTDSTAKKISLKHAIIILTTTLGSDLAKRGNFGFGENNLKTKENQQKITEKLKEYFSPEIINRLDKICVFNNLTKRDLTKIAALEVEELNERLNQYQTKIKYQETTLDSFLSSLPTTAHNARTIRRQLRTQIEKMVAELILQKKNKKQLQLTMQENNLGIK
jgi:ATP-dependent Clp protease ATP-binding subunit ClpA